MLAEPQATRVVRGVVIAVLAAAFAVLTVFNVLRFTQSGYLVTEQAEYPGDYRLPRFAMSPINNHTQFSAVECALEWRDSLYPYELVNQEVDYLRQSRIEAWNWYQEVKVRLPNASLDEIVAEMRRLFGYFDQYQLRNLVTGGSIDNLLGYERWGSRIVNFTLGDDQKNAVFADSITCRIKGLQEISVENATVTTPTVVRDIPINGTSVLVAEFQVQFNSPDYKRKAILSGQQLTLSYRLINECSGNRWGFSFLGNRWCYRSYERVSKDLEPANAYFLPEAFKKLPAADLASSAFVTVQLDRQYAGTLKRTRISPFGLLDLFTSLFAAVCFLLLVYTLLMGDFKLNPFGWVQRLLLRTSNKAYARQFRGDEQQLERTLFAFYLNDDQLQDRKNLVQRVVARFRGQQASDGEDEPLIV